MTVAAPVFTFEHSIATVAWADLAVEMGFDRFHEDRRSHELVAELTVFAGSNGSRSLLHRARLNLGSTRGRAEAARYLAGRHQGIDDWQELIELAAWKVVEAVRHGRPAILLRDAAEPAAGGGLVVPPLLLANDPVILFGDGGAAKSFMGLALAMSIDSRTPYADLPVSQPLRTAYLDFEWQAWPHRRRMRSLCPDGDLPELLYIPCGAEGPLSGQVERLQRIFREHRIQYAFVDSVALACAGAPEEAAVALDFFQGLTRLEVGSCLLAHVNRSGDEDRPFGSTFWHNSARMTWFLKSVQETGAPRLDVALYNRKVNDGGRAAPFALHFEFEPQRTIIRRANLDAIPELAGALPVKDRIRALLIAGPHTVAEVADRLDVSTETARRTLSRSEGRMFVRVPDVTPTRWGFVDR